MSLEDAGGEQIFRAARTHRHWLDKPVSDELIRAVYDLAKFGPTSANCSPLRIRFVKSPAAKARLKPHLASGNVDKTMQAPVTAILAYDTLFYEYMEKLSPHNPNARSWFEVDEDSGQVAAFRNGTLQAAYFLIAARSLGLDCGPMSGFDNESLDQDYFPDGRFKSNFLCNLGFGDPSRLHDREPRFDFHEVCRID